MPPEPYDRLITDLPSRSFEIYEKFKTAAKAARLDITLMIAVAFSGFVIPFERLRQKTPHQGPRQIQRSQGAV